jgi:hypothetical protein
LYDYCQLTGKKYGNVRALLNKRLKENPEVEDKTLKDYLKESDNRVKVNKPKRKFNI